MKIIIENSAYLIVMAIICLLSIDFISMNINVSHINETEQYIEDYIEMYGQCQEDNSLDKSTIAEVQNYLCKRNMKFGYEYKTKTDKYAYYGISVEYELSSRVFGIKKSDTFDGLVRVEIDKNDYVG